MSQLNEHLIVDDDDVSPAPRRVKKTRKTRASPRVAADSLYSTTATPHSDDGYKRMPSERTDDLYAKQPTRPPHRTTTNVPDDTAAVEEYEDEEEEQEVEDGMDVEVVDGKRRRYTCWGACRGCHMTKTQYVLSVMMTVLLVVTAVLLIVFLAIIPAMISGIISSSDIAVTGVSITSPNATSFHLQSSFVLSNTGKFAATLSPMTVSLSYRQPDNSLSSPVGGLSLPGIALPGGEDVMISVDTIFDVADHTAFDSFMHATLLQDTITWHLSSSVSVAAKLAGIALPTYTSIPFEKDISVSGCGGLNDTTVERFNLSHPASTPGDANLTLYVSIVNPSAFTISPLGTLHFMVSYQSVHIGDVYSYDTQLVPGANNLTMIGTLLRSNTSAENELIQQFVAGQIAVATATAASDASSVPLFNGGMQGLTLQTALPGYTGQIIKSVALSSFGISFDASAQSTVMVASFAQASFGLPPNVNMPVLDITNTNITATAFYNGNESIGVMTATNAPVVYIPGTNGPDSLNITIPASPLQVSTDQTAAFSQFASDLLLSSMAVMQLQMTAQPLTTTPLGVLSLSVPPTTANVTLKGMNRFISPITGLSMMTVVAFDIVDTSPGYIILNVTMNITNPSNVSLGSLGDLRLDLAYNGTRMGRVTVLAFELPLGTTQQEAMVNLSKPTTEAEQVASMGLISAMINRTDSNITLHGGLQQPDGSVVAGTDIALLQQAVSSFAADTIFPGLTQPLISHFKVFLPFQFVDLAYGGCVQLYVNTTMYVSNPFSTYMYITGTDIEVYLNPATVGISNITAMSILIGDWHADLSANPLVVPPHSNASNPVGPFLIRLTLGTIPTDVLAAIFNTALNLNAPLQLDSVGSIRTNLTTADPQHGGAGARAFVQRVHVDARNVTSAIGYAYTLPDDVLPPVTWGPPLLNNGTCIWGCKTQCTVPCYCDAVLCKQANCASSSNSSFGSMWDVM